MVILSLMTAVAWGVNPKFGKLTAPGKSLILDSTTFLWINSVLCMVYNNGNFAYDDAGFLGKTDGFYFPFASEKDNKTVLYAAGIWAGAKVNDEIRVAIAEFSSEFVPGPMLDGEAQSDRGSFRVYKLGDGTDLDGKTPYDDTKDRAEWPAEDGAPVDEFGDPEVLGNQMCWSVYNDADPAGHVNMETRPLGLEIQQSTFGFSVKGPLDNVIFMKYIIINKGNNTLDSTFISLWADPDVGDAGDDFVGCDTILSLGYAYNDGGDVIYGTAAPAVGFDFFQGPLIDSPGDTAYLPSGPVPDKKQLGMTSFNKYINGTDPQTPIETYNYMRGLNRDGTPAVDPNTSEETKFVLAGDPVTATGWIDAQSDDRRWMMTTGPFTMEPGDTQIVVAAAMAAQGTDALNSITELKKIDESAQIVYDLNFDIPQPPPTPTLYARGYENAVELVWLNDAEGPENYMEDFRAELGQLYIFEGYNVYMGDSPTGPWTKVATYDLTADESQALYEDAVNAYVDCDYDSISGEWDCSAAEVSRIWDFALLYEDAAKERLISQEGSETGANYQMYFERDPRDGSSLVPYKPYYFAVTGYGVNIEQVYAEDSVFFGPNFAGMLSFNLESKIRGTTVIPYGSAARLEETAEHVTGLSDGVVEVEYLVQDSVTGDRYQVNFNEDFTWNLDNLSTGQRVLASYESQIDDFTFPIVNGLMIRTTGPNPGFSTVDEAYDDSTLFHLDGYQAYMGGRNVLANANYRDFVVKFLAAPGDTVPGPIINDGEDDYTTIRYLDENGDTIWGYFYGGSRAEEEFFKVSVPFAIYDIGTDINSTDDDVRLWPLMYDFYGDLRWYSDDYILFLDKNTGDGANIYGNDFWSYALHDGDAEYWGFDPGNPTSRRDWDYRIYGWAPYGAIDGWHEGDSLLLISYNGNTPDDTFEFQSRRIGQGDGTNVVKTMDNIKTVPNPYYNYSVYEADQFGRIVRFINLPGGVTTTIRIFNIAGDHVRTLIHEAGEDSWEDWDLKTENGLYVASGIYIYSAESEIGEKIGKMALFTEVEQLNTY